MQLVECGRVNLDEPAGTYLPELSRVKLLEEFEVAVYRAGAQKIEVQPCGLATQSPD